MMEIIEIAFWIALVIILGTVFYIGFSNYQESKEYTDRVKKALGEDYQDYYDENIMFEYYEDGNSPENAAREMIAVNCND